MRTLGPGPLVFAKKARVLVAKDSMLINRLERASHLSNATSHTFRELRDLRGMVYTPFFCDSLYADTKEGGMGEMRNF